MRPRRSKRAPIRRPKLTATRRLDATAVSYRLRPSPGCGRGLWSPVADRASAPRPSAASRRDELAFGERARCALPCWYDHRVPRFGSFSILGPRRRLGPAHVSLSDVLDVARPAQTRSYTAGNGLEGAASQGAETPCRCGGTPLRPAPAWSRGVTRPRSRPGVAWIPSAVRTCH
jgi:hypothetical protein